MDTVEPASDGHPPRVAVLGGTGFVGRPLCRALADAGVAPVVLARRPAPVDGAHAVVGCDLTATDAGALAALLDQHGVTAVVNAAGGMWGLTDQQMVDANVTLVERVIGAVSRLGRPVRLVQLGTVHEYGLVPLGTSMREDQRPEPVTAYGRLKLQCTEAVVTATAQRLVDGVVLRVGNVIGAGQPEVSLLGMVARRLRAAGDGGGRARLELNPLGSQRDFLNLADAVDAVVAAVAAPTLSTGVLNIGSGEATAARDLVLRLIELSGVPADLVEVEAEPETTWQRMDCRAAMDVLGWSADPDVTRGLTDLWRATAPGRVGVS